MNLTAKKYIGWLFCTVVLIYFIYLIKGVLLPFVAGAFIAYALNPLTTKIESIPFVSRASASTLSTIIFILVLVLFFLLVVPTLQTELAKIASKMPVYGSIIQNYWISLVDQLSDKLDPEDMAKIQDGVKSYSIKLFEWLGRFVLDIISNTFAIFNFFTILIVTPITVYYLLHDWKKLIDRVHSWVPRDSLKVFDEQVGLIDRTLAGFARGQAVVCIVLCFYYIVGLKIAGLEGAFTVGLVTGILAFVPYVGAIIGYGLAMLLATSQFDILLTPFVWISGVFLIGQLFEGKVLIPNLIGGKIGLHPLWVIFSLFAGGAIAGFPGIFIAVPVAGVVGVLVRYTFQNYKKTAFYLGQQSDKPPKKAKA